jgi:cytochrome c553
MADWNRDEAFWLVRNGLKYTGMPGWPGENRDDEIWSVVAFLLALPEFDAAQYQALADGNSSPPQSGIDAIMHAGRSALRQTACARCHDTADAPPISALVPSLGLQSETYLVQALQSYRDGTRESGIMEPVAAELSDTQIAGLAATYAELDTPSRRGTVDPALLEAGRRLAHEGDTANAVPPCDACHATDSLASYPRLAGLSAEYQVAQLELWRRGGRNESPPGATMATIAERLTSSQIQAASDYYASLQRTRETETGSGDVAIRDPDE